MGTVIVFPDTTARTSRVTGAPAGTCCACGGRRYFYVLSAWETRVARRVEAVCGCMKGCKTVAELVGYARERGALLQPCNQALVDTVIREGVTPW